MNDILDVIGLTFGAAGTILIALTVLNVHYRVWQEHKIDEQVFTAMKRERKRAMVGLIFIVIGFLLQVGVIIAA